ncbi:hypothetical protein RIF29_33957 [Crotalaria pallida]|uniref:Uncharacterized protein n=1 Tax=Crotalaria pallida TaxID=3830 RepID=A0AAN9HT43_CROPI
MMVAISTPIQNMQRLLWCDMAKQHGMLRTEFRAFETAQIIASRCGGPQIIKDPDLRERHIGDLQGFIYHELAKTHPMAYKVLESGNEDEEIPLYVTDGSLLVLISGYMKTMNKQLKTCPKNL